MQERNNLYEANLKSIVLKIDPEKNMAQVLRYCMYVLYACMYSVYVFFYVCMYVCVCIVTYKYCNAILCMKNMML